MENKNVRKIVIFIILLTLLLLGIFLIVKGISLEKGKNNKSAIGNLNKIDEEIEDDFELSYNEKEAIAEDTLNRYLEETLEGKMSEIRINEIKVFTDEEIQNMPELEDIKLKKNDIVFEISYELKTLDGVDMVQFTDGTGYISDGWIIDINNVGIIRKEQVISFEVEFNKKEKTEEIEETV